MIEQWLAKIPATDLAAITKPLYVAFVVDVLVWLVLMHVIIIAVAKASLEPRKLGTSYWVFLAMSVLFMLHFALIWLLKDKVILLAYS